MLYTFSFQINVKISAIIPTIRDMRHIISSQPPSLRCIHVSLYSYLVMVEAKNTQFKASQAAESYVS